MPAQGVIEERVAKFLSGISSRIMDSAKAIGGDATEEALKSSTGFSRFARGLRGVPDEAAFGGPIKGIEPEKFTEALRQGYLHDPRADISIKNLNKSAIAGSYIGASAAYRVASGGGLTKDSSGNTNIIGIPLI